MSERQLGLLRGEGRRPDADRIEAEFLAAGECGGRRLQRVAVRVGGVELRAAVDDALDQVPL
ncbi:hypothetical protein [Actinacidiphila oryziradicis]|uniref:Uncharacterized protein n=1 Tax=Actinacidiphila oryziradicis TaxID=2571141 RepID=A0A4U0RI49_9ACTN|nr:hypothetical protein [Actinacidiphila oryziradicis]TJZ94390.1 hypothetical protein FCI23_53845 [Actinacidiphila oryziradicis]